MADYIDRQVAIDAIRNIKAIKGTSDDKILLIDKAEAQTELMMLPSADVQPVHYAIWKLFSEYKRHWGKVTVKTVYCSHCGHEERVEHRKFDDYALPNFCSNCGYGMRWVD